MSRRRAAFVVAVPILVAACDRQPTAPQIQPRDREPSYAHVEQTGPPNRTFGPDTRETGGPYTGQGVVQPGLTCVPVGSGRRRCDGYLPSDVDGTMLDVTVDVPSDPTPDDPNDFRNVPLVALLHGWAGSKGGEGDIADRLLNKGYAVLRYSARGFGNSFGRVNLADIGVEVAPYADPAVCAPRAAGDLQSMIGEVVDRILDEAGQPVIKPDAVAVTGVSYGGGQSWLATLRPHFRSAGGTCVRIATVVPIVPWTDLLYSLLPNGEPHNSVDPLGALKLSYVNALYFSGCSKEAGTPPCENYPTYLKVWHAWLNAIEPNPFDPVYRRIRDGVAGYRSIWWQREFWNTTAPSKLVPVFQVQGFTDDLFTLAEARRMLLALEPLGYPIKSYFGDIGHPRARNDPNEVEYVLRLIDDWLGFYLKGVGAQPTFQIHAAVTPHAGEHFPAGNIETADRYADLATGQVTHEFAVNPPAPLANPFSGAPSGPLSDPALEAGLVAAGELEPLPGSPPVPNVPDPTAQTYVFPPDKLKAPVLVAGQPMIRLRGATTGLRVQFNVRVYDVASPLAGTKELVTRGTLTVQSRTFGPIRDFNVVIPTAGNLWRVPEGHFLQFEITNVDAPYLAPSRLPSVTRISSVEVTIPTRQQSPPTTAP